MNAIECKGLGKRYSDTWALRGCELEVPTGRVVALVGPNGAGKTTLLHLIVGLTSPTEGYVKVLDGLLPGSESSLKRVAFVPQDVQLYKHLSVGDCVHVARNLNSVFDDDFAERRLRTLGIPARKRIGKLSGGQEAQLGLTLALARRSELLVMDEPVARLDPVARLEFMAELMEEVASRDLSVVLSSHVIADLERVADYLVVVACGTVRLAGDIDELLADHRVMYGPYPGGVPDGIKVVSDDSGFGGGALVQRPQSGHQPLPNGWELSEVGLEGLVLGYLRDPPQPTRRVTPLLVCGRANRRS